MAKFTTIKTTQTETGWKIDVDGTHYADAPTLTEAKAVLADRPWPIGLEAGQVEFTVHTIACTDAEVAEGAKVVFPNAKVA